MANNMIALQVRPPQSGGMNNLIQQNAQLINMVAQQRAAEAQAARDQQQLQAAQAKETREKAAAQIELAGKQIDYHYKRATAVSSPQGYEAWLAGVEKDSPEFATFFRTNMPPEQFNRDQLIRMVGGIKENFDATYGPVNTEVVIGAKGRPAVVTRGGFNAPNIVYPKTFDQKKPKETKTPVPPRTGTVEVEPAVTVDTPGTGGPYEPVDQSATAASPQMAPGATPSNMIVDGAKMLGAIIEEPNPAKREADYQLFLTSLDKTAPQLAQLIRQNAPTFNLQYANKVLSAAKDYLANPQGDGSMMPAPTAAPRAAGQVDFPLVQGPRGGPYEGYEETTPFMAKDPSVSPYPGSAQVPLPRVAAEAAVSRPSGGEIRRNKTIEKEVETEFEKKKSQKGRQQVSLLLGKLRAAYEALESNKAIPSEKRGAFANALDYLGATSLGREAQKFIGTSNSKYLTEITGARKLLATAIKNATGMSAQEMNSNTELMLMLDALTDPTQGIEAARSQLDTIQELYGDPNSQIYKARAAPKNTPVPTPADVDYVRRHYKENGVRDGFIKHFGYKAYRKALGI